MQACWGAPRGKAVCHNSQSASLLSDSGLVIYFKLRRRRSLFLEAWHTLQEERRMQARRGAPRGKGRYVKMHILDTPLKVRQNG